MHLMNRSHDRQQGTAFTTQERVITPSREEEESSLELQPASSDQVNQLNDDLPSEERHAMEAKTPQVTPRAYRSSLEPDEEEGDTSTSPSDLESRKLAILEAQEALSLPKPPSTSSGVTASLDPRVKTRAPPSITNFCWEEGAVTFVEEMASWLEGSHGGVTNKPLEVGDVLSPAVLPPPNAMVQRYSYRPANPSALATKFAEAESGDRQPFKDARGIAIPLEAPTTVSPKTLQTCESSARLLMGAANSAVLFQRRIGLMEDSMPEAIRPALQQLSNDLAAVVKYGWQNVTNWQLIRRQGALELLQRHYCLSKEEVHQLYRAPLTGSHLFGPSTPGESNALEKVFQAAEVRAQKYAVFATSTGHQTSATSRAARKGRKRAATAMAPPLATKVPRSASARQVSFSQQGQTQVTLANKAPGRNRPVMAGLYPSSTLSFDQGKAPGKSRRNRKRGKKAKRQANWQQQGPPKGKASK